MPLQTTCLVGAAHPHGTQDMQQSTTLHQLNPPTGAQRGVTLPKWQLHRALALVLLRSCAQRGSRAACKDAETAAWLAHRLREFVETRGQTRECCLVRTESEELRTHRGARTHDHKVKGHALC